ncbi:MAG: hypothetical protein A3F78_04065 [Burkholderiales bacterium RIFCSPLOWO2_12_FULL_61_40]|nr:MAG: hypothetical protein A3F78_04065 [Burkholderiales bacterium RIFCSPLOWO2_12_FULL_61_40]
MHIRNFHPSDAPALRAVFYSSVHDLARHHYTAEPFFVRWGFGVEARQQVERSGVVLANARMGKVLAANRS